MFRTLYLNGWKGRMQANIGLQLGAEKEAEVVVIAEAVRDTARRNQHPTYNLVMSTAYMAIYFRKD